MSPLKSTQWLVCYDIRDPRRLGRVFRHLKKHGVPIQYSVYLVDASPARLRMLLIELAALIDPRADDIRAYGLPANPSYDTLGASMLPSDSMPMLGLQ